MICGDGYFLVLAFFIRVGGSSCLFIRAEGVTELTVFYQHTGVLPNGYVLTTHAFYMQDKRGHEATTGTWFLSWRGQYIYIKMSLYVQFHKIRHVGTVLRKIFFQLSKAADCTCINEKKML